MRRIDHKKSLIDILKKDRSIGKTIGFVPTMGALHEGHLDLIKASVKETDITVCSIYINPTQFNNPEDLQNYPRKESEDIEKLKNTGCNYVYIPANEDIYSPRDNQLLSLDFGSLAEILEGKYRPGHFNGVGLVVAKLFNIVLPDIAYFGQKDLQQYYLVYNLVESLSFHIKLRCITTRREYDGLAMSSRNLRIPKDVRPYANGFYSALKEGLKLSDDGFSVNEIKSRIAEIIRSKTPLTLEYFAFVNVNNFTIETKNIKKGKTALVIAGYINNIRLIDNVMYI